MFTVFSRDDTYEWPSTTRVKLIQSSQQQAEHMYSREYTWKHVLMEQYQLWTNMTRANWFRNGSLFAGDFCHYMHLYDGDKLTPVGV